MVGARSVLWMSFTTQGTEFAGYTATGPVHLDGDVGVGRQLPALRESHQAGLTCCIGWLTVRPPSAFTKGCLRQVPHLSRRPAQRAKCFDGDRAAQAHQFGGGIRGADAAQRGSAGPVFFRCRGVGRIGSFRLLQAGRGERGVWGQGGVSRQAGSGIQPGVGRVSRSQRDRLLSRQRAALALASFEERPSARRHGTRRVRSPLQAPPWSCMCSQLPKLGAVISPWRRPHYGSGIGTRTGRRARTPGSARRLRRVGNPGG